MISSSVLIVVIKNATAKRRRFPIPNWDKYQYSCQESGMIAHTTECSRRMLNQFPIPDPSGYLSKRL
jgi:hypothetical protein